MKPSEALKIMQIEKECVLRQDTNKCNRDTCGCQCCDLIQDADKVVTAYELAILALAVCISDLWGDSDDK